MGLSISGAVKKTDIPATTIRYYDKKGLLPFVRHDENGHRDFTKHDITMLQLISCLKNTGMELSHIRDFVQMCQDGDTTLEERLALFEHQKTVIEDRIKQDQKYLQTVEHKINYYKAACAAGTEDAVSNEDCE
ncbi:hypothetical protein IV38_GL000924 [Lactobacillus selangorensis]|uniref:HTH merR-type domain-containing protein n=1 Tax=Lactobacillus selangorensis TaxID=81857 RepID=A0A0R2G0C8_9LACO|nr:MerR family transcriptional regulator [Lactobacillus selangorensis]KRN28720.1 hypothetical protein IV38_GL000924 [Lactobacillus selangorensis]KRN32870.1 hypothetical protein IV40_GL000929 [Lactobacillus selangorensis]